MAYLRAAAQWNWGPGRKATSSDGMGTCTTLADCTNDGVVGDVANGWNSAKTLLELDQEVNERLIFYKALWESPNAVDATEEAWGVSRTYSVPPPTYLGISTCHGTDSHLRGANAVRRL